MKNFKIIASMTVMLAAISTGQLSASTKCQVCTPLQANAVITERQPRLFLPTNECSKIKPQGNFRDIGGTGVIVIQTLLCDNVEYSLIGFFNGGCSITGYYMIKRSALMPIN